MFWIRPRVLGVPVFARYAPVEPGDLLLVHQDLLTPREFEITRVPQEVATVDDVMYDWIPGGPSAVVQYRVRRFHRRFPGLWCLQLLRVGHNGELN
ncbi:MAG: hypothetical protein ACE5KM_24295 [Planctomycetaceae bacterium]